MALDSKKVVERSEMEFGLNELIGRIVDPYATNTGKIELYFADGSWFMRPFPMEKDQTQIKLYDGNLRTKVELNKLDNLSRETKAPF